jgi:hypothetical protein
MAGLATMNADAGGGADVLAPLSRASFPGTTCNGLVSYRSARTVSVLVQQLRYSPAVFGREQGRLRDLVMASGEEGSNASVFAAAAPAGACRNESGKAR